MAVGVMRTQSGTVEETVRLQAVGQTILSTAWCWSSPGSAR
jgi:hypothetical protein